MCCSSIALITLGPASVKIVVDFFGEKELMTISDDRDSFSCVNAVCLTGEISQRCCYVCIARFKST